MTTPPLIDAVRLERRFGRAPALRAVDLAVGAGELVLLAGPNGAGKSTLLRCLAGLLRPTSGTILLAGRDLRRDPAARGAVGFLSHQSFLYDDLTARENLRFAAALHSLVEVEAVVDRALDEAGLTSRNDLRVSGMSHGTRQRLAIARALLHAPAVLLLDEPFSGLDAAAATMLRRRIATELARGRAIVCVTHQPADIWQLATRVVVLDRGRTVLDGPRQGSLEAFVAACAQLLAA